MPLLSISWQSDVARAAVGKTGKTLGGPLLDRLVSDFVGAVTDGELKPESVAPGLRLEDCIRLTTFEGSTVDLLGRGIHAIWTDTTQRNRLLDEERGFVRPVAVDEFRAAINELIEGFTQIDTKLAKERPLRTPSVRRLATDLAKLEASLRVIVGCKSLHSALLMLGSAAAANVATTPAITLRHVAATADTVMANLPRDIATGFRPASGTLRQAADSLDADPDSPTRGQTLSIIPPLVDAWLPRLALAVLDETQTLRHRDLASVAEINADRSLLLPLLKVSVMWRQTVFAIGIWLEITLLLGDIQALCDDLRSGLSALDLTAFESLETYIQMLGPEEDDDLRALAADIADVIVSSGGIHQATGGGAPDEQAYRKAVGSFVDKCAAIIEAVRLKRIEADGPAHSFAMELGRLGPILTGLGKTMRLP